MTIRRVNIDTGLCPDPQVIAWLEANHIDPKRVWAHQEVLVTDDVIAYIGWQWPRRMLPDESGFVKRAYVAPRLSGPESFGLPSTVEEEEEL